MKKQASLSLIHHFSHQFTQLREEDATQKGRIHLLKGLKKKSLNLENATKAQKDDKNLALVAINQSAQNFLFLSDRLKDDEYVVYQAVKKDGLLLEHASERLKNHEKTVWSALLSNPLALEFASEALQDNEAMVNFCVNKSGQSLLFANKRFKEDKDLVKLAITNYPHILKDINNDDEAFVQMAYWKDRKSFQYASERIKSNGKFILQHQISFNEHWGQTLKQDKHFILKFIQQHSITENFIQFISPSLQENREVVLACVQSEARNFEFVRDEFKNDFEIASIAIEKIPYLLRYASDALRNDKKILLKAIKNKKFDQIFIYAGEEIQKLVAKDESPYEKLNQLVAIDEEKAILEKSLGAEQEIQKKVKI